VIVVDSGFIVYSYLFSPAVVTLVLSQSMVGEAHSLDRAAQHCSAIPPSLRVPITLDAATSCPETCLFRARLLVTMCEWKAFAADQHETSSSDSSSSLPKLYAHASAMAAPRVLSAVTALLLHLERFVARAVEEQSWITAVAEEESQGESEAGSPWFTDFELIGSDVRATTKVANQSTDSRRQALSPGEYLLHAHSLLHCRCAISVVMLGSGEQAQVRQVADRLDALVMRLANSCVLGNAARMRVGQLLCVTLLEQTQASCGHAQSGAVPLDTFMTSPTVGQMLRLLRTPFGAKSPALLSATSGVIRFVKCAAATHPHVRLRSFISNLYLARFVSRMPSICWESCSTPGWAWTSRTKPV
jgi:hypothetical protein